MSEPTMPQSADAIERYARALLEIADAEGVIERLEDELFRVARAVESNPRLAERLTDPSLEVPERLALVDALLSGRAHPQTLSAVMYVVQSGRARQLGEIADAVVRLVAESRAEAVAEVRTAVPLDADRRRRLAEALSAATGRQVRVKHVVDPSVLGGVVAKMGDTVIDGSVSRRLAELRSRLTGV